MTVSIYIKRAEENQDSEYISLALANSQYGVVKSIKFLPKEDHMGKKYNGAIVQFERWFTTPQVKKLFSEMAVSQDGTTRLYHDVFNSRYWHVMEFKSAISEEYIECDELTNIQSLYKSDTNEYVKQMEKLVETMAAQMYYYQNQIRILEQKNMELEEKHTYQSLVNGDLLCQLDEKEAHITAFEWKNKVLEMEKAGLQERAKNYEEEARDANNILNYVNEEALQMKLMLETYKLSSSHI